MKSYLPRICLSLVVLTLCVPGLALAEDAASLKSSVERILDQNFSIEMENAHISDILAHITSEYDLNIMIDNRVVQPKDAAQIDPEAEYVTDGMLPFVNLQDVSLGDALQAVLRPLGLAYSVQPNYIWVSTPDHIRHETFEDLETRTYPLNGRYVENVNADKGMETGHRIPVVNLLRHVVPVIVEPVSKKPLSYIKADIDKIQVVVYNTPSNHKIVEQILELTGHKAAEHVPALSAVSRMLDRPFDMEMENAHLIEIFDFIQSGHGVKIAWDPRLIRPRAAVFRMPGVSYVTDGMIDSANLNGMTLGAALGKLLEPLGLTYFAHENLIWIASPDRVRQSQFGELETRFYELSDFEIIRHDDDSANSNIPMEQDFFSHVVPFVIDPESKRLVSFSRYNIQLQQLVVHTTPENHELLESVLQLLEPPSQRVTSRS